MEPNFLIPFAKVRGRDLTSKQIGYNYQISYVRRLIENVFGILVSRFRLFQGPMQVTPEVATLLIAAACVLHNILRKKNPKNYLLRDVDQENANGTFRPGNWRREVDTSESEEFDEEDQEEKDHVEALKSARLIREKFANYFYANKRQ